MYTVNKMLLVLSCMRSGNYDRTTAAWIKYEFGTPSNHVELCLQCVDSCNVGDLKADNGHGVEVPWKSQVTDFAIRVGESIKTTIIVNECKHYR